MKTSQPHVYVWIWLPGSPTPVVAGVIAPTGQQFGGDNVLLFAYGLSYLERSDAISLWTPELPLRAGTFDPRQSVPNGDPLPFASCLRDAAPDAWGRRVINVRSGSDPTQDLNELTYLLSSGSNRIGAVDFQARSDVYVSRDDPATLEQLMNLAELVELGQEIPDSLAAAALHGTSIGGARPKALLTDGDRELIAKFSSADDSHPVVKAEGFAMLLAARSGLDVAPVELRRVSGKDVLLVERFDRVRRGEGVFERRGMLSMLTVLGLNAVGSWRASYAEIAQQIRSGEWVDVPGTLREVFSRLVFNIMIGNNDDHLRNHAAFWDGRTLSLTPAYDVAPQVRGTNTSSQAIAITRDGQRASQLRLARAVAPEFLMTTAEADEIIGRLRSSIETHWDECADIAELTKDERRAMWGRQFLNPYIDYDHS
jgi:serine/threonine-protein kinase HipA